MNSDQKFFKPDNVFFKKNSSGTYVLANAEDDDFGIIELEETAAVIWEKLVSGMTVGEIIDSMSDEFEASSDDIKNDVEEFITQLLEVSYLLPVK